MDLFHKLESLLQYLLSDPLIDFKALSVQGLT